MTALHDAPPGDRHGAEHRYPSAGRWRTLEGPAWNLVRTAQLTLRVPADRSALRRSLGRPPEHPMTQPAHRIVGPCLRFLPDPDERRLDRRTQIEIDATERAFYTVAALIASQPRAARDSQLAHAAAKAAGVAEHQAAMPPAGHHSPDTTSDASTGADPAPTAETTSGGIGDTVPAAGPVRSRSLGRCLGEAINRSGSDRAVAYGRLESRLRLLCRQDLEGLHRHLPRLIRQLRSDDIDIDWVRLVIDLSRWGTDADQVAKTWLQQFYRTARPASAAGASDSEHLDTVDDSESERP